MCRNLFLIRINETTIIFPLLIPSKLVCKKENVCSPWTYKTNKHVFHHSYGFHSKHITLEGNKRFWPKNYEFWRDYIFYS